MEYIRIINVRDNLTERKWDMVKSKSHQNRGLKFEARVEKKCQEYHDKELALIHKVPTEFKVIRNGAKIVSAFPVKDSKFIDFTGLCNGNPIAIECKETKNKTSFPLSNISDYQLKFIDQWLNLGGKAFLLVNFDTHNKVFLVEGRKLLNCIDNLDRKSITYEWFLENTIHLDDDLEFLEYIE